MFTEADVHVHLVISSEKKNSTVDQMCMSAQAARFSPEAREVSVAGDYLVSMASEQGTGFEGLVPADLSDPLDQLYSSYS